MERKKITLISFILTLLILLTEYGHFNLIEKYVEPSFFLQNESYLGSNEAIRTYMEFADGTHRGMYDAETGVGGFPDEDYDATTAMVINWHSLPEKNKDHNARLEYRREYPSTTAWQVADGNSYKFWFRNERVNRLLLTNLQPNSVYAFRVKDGGKIFRFRTLPADLEKRSVKMVITGDMQRPSWDDNAHDIAKMAALLQPDMFVVKGDYINDEGRVTDENASRWALYLDTLYGTDNGYFIYDTVIDGRNFSNMIIPHIGILGNHETGDWHHLRRPACPITSSTSRYPEYTAANWMELLFHFPYSSEGFYSEYRPDHPNINPDRVQEGFGHGGFGKLSFGDYLLFIALDSSQNWEGEPDQGLRDWQGNLITDKWPWYEKHYSDIRQDLWLKNLLEPEDGLAAGQRYKHIIPVWHRGLFGSVRMNMTIVNRDIMGYWLPVLYRNGVKFIGESHDHVYGRSIPMGISNEQPVNTYVEKIYYNPLGYNPSSWDIPELQSYLDDFFSVNTLKDRDTNEIVGWEYKGKYINYDPEGMRAFGYGGWAAGRRDISLWGAGNAGWWFRDEDKGGAHLSGDESYNLNVVTLSSERLLTEAIHPSQLETIKNGNEPEYIHRIYWDTTTKSWSDLNMN